MRSSRRGQALIEFAIIGSLGLLAMAFLIQMGLRMYYQQELEQQTFRWALRTARNLDEPSRRGPESVSFVHLRNRQVPDPSDGFAMMPRVATQAQSTVTWGRFLTFQTDDRESKPRLVLRVDDAEVWFPTEEIPEGAPLIRGISTTTRARGTSSQTNAASALSTTTTQETSVQLNAGAGAVDSVLTSDVNLDW